MGDQVEFTPKALEFVLKCERAWIGLVASNNNRMAEAYSPVVDALIDNNPKLAIELASKRNLPASTIRSISEAFDLTD